jgi:hypothetical protein
MADRYSTQGGSRPPVAFFVLVGLLVLLTVDTAGAPIGVTLVITAAALLIVWRLTRRAGR